MIDKEAMEAHDRQITSGKGDSGERPPAVKE